MKLIFPEAILKQHLIALGKTGAGKSSALRHIVEHLLRENKRVCIIDPKGDWWGLKWNPDGKRQGFPVIAFGDFKEPKATDVPTNEHAGKDVAELIAEGNRPCIIGFGGWMPGAMVRFWIDFASTLFLKNRGELYLVGDEFHNFAPKGKIMDPQAGKCLHWSNRLLSEGRGLGIVCLLASQRPQKVHNDTLTSCETLIAMRVIHASDRKAIQEWIEGCGDMTQGKEVLNNLAGMSRGQAYVWSPEIEFGPECIKFPMFETFDSFAPPQVQKGVTRATWENVDLGAITVKLAKIIEEHKANDPAELKRTIVDLKRKLGQANQKQPEVKQVDVQVPVLDLDSHNALERVETVCNKVIHDVREVEKELHAIRAKIEDLQLKHVFLRQQASSTSRPSQPERGHASPVRVARPAVANGSVGGGMRRMLIALAQRAPLTKKQLAVRAGLSANSGTFGSYLSDLRSQGLISGLVDSITITGEGIESLGVYDPLPTGRALLEYWTSKLGGGTSRMLITLADAYPNSVSKEDLGQAVGMSPVSGTFGTYLSKLRTLELIEGSRELRASDELF